MPIFQLLVLASLQVAGSSEPVPAQLGTTCLLEKLSSEERRELGDNLLASRIMSDEQDARLDGLMSDCTERFELTPAQVDEALLGVLTSLIVERSGATLADAGVPPEYLDDWFDGQSPDLRSDLERQVSDTETDARIESLLTVMEKNGVPQERTRQNAHLVVLYLRSRSLLYRLENGLSLSEQMPPAR